MHACNAPCGHTKLHNKWLSSISKSDDMYYHWEACGLNVRNFSPAKLRIPKQLDGWSWRSKNLQHASRTDCICNKLEAGNKTCMGEKMKGKWMKATTSGHNDKWNDAEAFFFWFYFYMNVCRTQHFTNFLLANGMASKECRSNICKTTEHLTWTLSSVMVISPEYA